MQLDESESMSKLRPCANTNKEDTQDVDVHAESIVEIHEDCRRKHITMLVAAAERNLRRLRCELGSVE